ncbi:MAG: hypothetical protein WC070_03600 [Candidatus Magasanikbacteria bacterium]
MFYLLLLGIAIVNVFLASFLVSLFYWLALLIGGLGGIELLHMFLLVPTVLFSIFFVLLTIISTKVLGKKIIKEYPKKNNISIKIFFIVLILGFTIHFLYDYGIIHGPKRGDEFIDEKKENVLEDGKTVVFEGVFGRDFPTKDDKVLLTIHNTVGGTNVLDSYLLSLDKNSKQYELKQISDLRKGNSVERQNFGQEYSIFYIVENQNNNAYSLYSYDLSKNSTSNIDKVNNWEENKRILDKYNSSILKDDCNYKDYYFYEDDNKKQGHKIYACNKDLVVIYTEKKWKVYNTFDNTLVYLSDDVDTFTSHNTGLITDKYLYYNNGDKQIVRVDLNTKEEVVLVEDTNILDFSISDNFVVYKNGIDNSWEYKGQLIVVKLK